MKTPNLVLHNGKITTLNDTHPQVSAVAMAHQPIGPEAGDHLGRRLRRDLHATRDGGDRWRPPAGDQVAHGEEVLL